MDLGIKVLHINTFDIGGAANSCMRLHKSLLQYSGVHSNLLLKHKTHEAPNTSQYFDCSTKAKLKAKLRRILFEFRVVKDPLKNKQQISRHEFIKQLPKGSEYFSFPTTGIDITKELLYNDADIIHLHWVADFLDYPAFFKQNKKPLVWTLHDMAPFSGGLHYQEKFIGVDQNGKPMPRNFTVIEEKVIKDNFKIKKDSLSYVDRISIVCPSKWLTNESEKSELFSKFPHYTIAYGVDEESFKVRDKSFSRDLLGLPRNKKIILFVADTISNNRKGFQFLSTALQQLENDNLLLCSVGMADAQLQPHNIMHLGRINDERLMSLAYSAADAFVIPSIEDNLPNTVLESLLCGTPVIGFPVGGIKETIENDFNGYLSDEISVCSLKDTIDKFLETAHKFDNQKISESAKEQFNLRKQAELYLGLYSEILEMRN